MTNFSEAPPTPVLAPPSPRAIPVARLGVADISSAEESNDESQLLSSPVSVLRTMPGETDAVAASLALMKPMTDAADSTAKEEASPISADALPPQLDEEVFPLPGIITAPFGDPALGVLFEDHCPTRWRPDVAVRDPAAVAARKRVGEQCEEAGRLGLRERRAGRDEGEEGSPAGPRRGHLVEQLVLLVLV